MNTLTKLYNKFIRKGKRALLIFSEEINTFSFRTDRRYKDFSEEGYKQCTEVFACINLKARTAKGVKWLVYRKPKSGKKLVEVEDFNDPLIKIIRRPNPYQSWARLIENISGYYDISGNVYIHRVGPSGNKPPKELWLLRPDRCFVIPNKNPAFGPVAYYAYGEDESTRQAIKPDRSIESVPWHQLLHIKTFNPLDDLYGMSTIEAASRPIDQVNEAGKLNFNLLKNGLRSSGAFISKGSVDEEDVKELKRQLEEQYAGSGNAGKQLLLEGDLDWKELGIKPKDMDWIEGQKMDTRRICSAFGVPPELIGDAQNKTYNNQKEARRALYVEATMPFLDEVRDELNAWLCPLFGDDYFLDYDRDDIEAIKDERNAIWMNVINAKREGVLTADEAREALGYEAVNTPESSKLIVSSGGNDTPKKPETAS